MAKKEEKEQTQTMNTDPFGNVQTDEQAFPGDFSDEGINFDTDFNLDDEYKPTPLAPKGNYFGTTSGLKWDASNNCLIWDVTLSDENDGVMSDGLTPIAGQVFDYRNWFPKAGDEKEMSARGRQTKRQAKINMIKDFADKMKIDMSTPKAIVDAINNAEWIGIPVIVSVSIDQYQGRFRNTVDRMVAREG
ncbi:MAG: hypothetical protein WDA47_04570 [Bacilli bacterium]